jgi:hypothetical protein
MYIYNILVHMYMEINMYIISSYFMYIYIVKKNVCIMYVYIYTYIHIHMYI